MRVIWSWLRNNHTLVSGVMLFAGISLITLQYMSGAYFHIFIFNSDALYLPTLTRDLLTKSGNMSDWYLTPAPYLFPDFVLFYLIKLTGAGTYASILAYAVLQTVFYFVIVWALARRCGLKKVSLTAAALSVLVSLWLAGHEFPFHFLLNSAFHFSVILGGLISVWLWLKIVELRQEANAVRFAFIAALFFLSFWTAVSDSLFLVQVAAPLFAVISLFVMIGYFRSLEALVVAVVNLIFSLAGHFAYDLIVTNPMRSVMEVKPGSIAGTMLPALELAFRIIVSNLVFAVVFAVFLAAVFVSARWLMSARKTTSESVNLSFLTIFSSLSILSTLGVMAVFNLIVANERYVQPLIFLPVIVASLFLAIKLRDRFFSLALPVSMACIALLGIGELGLVRKNGVSADYYPEEIACFDTLAREHNLKEGIGEYWDAKYLMNWSRQDVTVAQFYPDLFEFRWITSGTYYHDGYDFLVTSDDEPNQIDVGLVEKINGTPLMTADCGDLNVFIYPDDSLRTRKFSVSGGSWAWQACELPTQIGVETPECALTASADHAGGALTFGPYEALPAGTYAFEFSYSSPADGDAVVADWDAGIALPHRMETVARGQISGTGGQVSVLSGTFRIGADYDGEKVEVRTWPAAGAEITVYSLKIVRTL